MKRHALQLCVVITLLSLILVPLIVPAFANLSGDVVDCQVVDVDGDGFKDLRFHVTDQIGGVPGVEIRVKASFGNVLLTSRTNGTGYCIFNDMPSGNYSWEVSDAASNITGLSFVPMEQHGALSGEEAIVVQFLLLTWMSNATEKTKTFYENFSRYVGYDLSMHPFPSSTGENLSTFSTHLFQWYQGLDDCIVNNITDSEVYHILQRIVDVSREVCFRTLEDSLNPNSLGNVTEVRMGFKGQAENASLINYTVTYSDGNRTIENTILEVPASNAKTIAALSGIFVSSFDAFAKFPQFESSVWTFEAQSDDLLVSVYEFLDMSKNIYDSYVSKILDFVGQFSSRLNGFAATLGDSMTAIAGYTLGLMCYLELTYRFDGVAKILSNLQSGNLAAITLTIGMAAGFALGVICTALILAGVGASAIPIIGYAIAAIAIAVAAILARSDYESWLDRVRGIVGESLTQIMRVRQTLNEINTTQMSASATAYQQAAGLLHKFSYSSNAGNFSDYSATLEAYGQKQEKLAEAIYETRPALDNLINNFLFWSGPSGTIIGHLEGFESTWANWTDPSGPVSSIYPAGINYPPGYNFKKVTAWNLDPSPLFKNEKNYDSWTNDPSKLTDSNGNQFSVEYDNSTGIFKYNPQLRFLDGITTSVKNSAGNLDVFYQYKFFIDPGTTTYGFPDLWNILKWGLANQDVLTDWQNYLQSEYELQVLPGIQNISCLVEQLSPDVDPPETDLSVSNIRTDPAVWIDLLARRVHIGPLSSFTLTSDDAGSGVALISYRIFNDTFNSGCTTFASFNSNPLTFAIPQDLASGEYTIEFNSTDSVGNVETPKQFVQIPQLSGLLINSTMQSPVFVLERPELDVSPKIVNALVPAGSGLVLNLSISEVVRLYALDNVSLIGSILASVDNETISSGHWNFTGNYIRVPAGGQVNVTAILDLPPTTKAGNYTGAIEVSCNGEMREVLINITVQPARLTGDLNGDGTVNILDAITLGNAFLATPGSSNWNPNADINGDNVVNILDAIILGNNFLQHYP